MKNARKLTSILLLIAMLFMIAAPAMAANVTLPQDSDILKDHQFTAFQIFSGREEGNILSDVEWAENFDSTGFLTALKNSTDAAFKVTVAETDQEVNAFAECTTAAEVAATLGKYNSNTNMANAFAKLAYTYKQDKGTSLTSGGNNLPDGYYLIVDTTGELGEGGAYNAALLQVVGDEIEIKIKTDVPSVEKKVQENDKYTQDEGYGTGYNDVADYNIGEEVPFKLIGEVPDMSHYDTYKYIFHDTLSKGLTLNSDIKVYVANDKKGTDKQPINNGWSATPIAEGDSLTITFNDLKTVTGVEKGKYIIVEYTATLNKDAEIGLPGNPNTVKLEYSNKPDQSGEGNNNTGETPEDKVIVFTYELDTTKVDGKDNTTPLKDAQFVLMDTSKKNVAEIADGKFVKWVADSDIEKNKDGTYPDNYTLKSGENGLFTLAGLDNGQYYLKETKAPTGYNKLTSEVAVVITATTSNGQTWNNFAPGDALTKLDVTADGTSGNGDTATGIAAIKVVNNTGATLPETGGIGTTIFYVVGAALVVGAGVLLVTKKRMTGQR